MSLDRTAFVEWLKIQAANDAPIFVETSPRESICSALTYGERCPLAQCFKISVGASHYWPGMKLLPPWAIEFITWFDDQLNKPSAADALEFMRAHEDA